MRWLFGPPHLTLKPSKKTKQKKKRKKKRQNNTKIPKNELFSNQSNFCFFGGCPNFPVFDNLAQKARPPKNRFASRSVHFWTKKPKTRNSSYLFFRAFSSLSTTKTQKCSETPNFYSVVASLKERNFKICT